MDKQHILDEIKRTARANGGTPLGEDAISRETGILEKDWKGKHWARFGDAHMEAGFQPNAFGSPRFADDELIEGFIKALDQLNRFPTFHDLRLLRRQDSTIPNPTTLKNHFGNKESLARAVFDFCQRRRGYPRVVAVCQPIVENAETAPRGKAIPNSEIGFVYLMKSGKYNKIGRSNSPGRRVYELGIKMPEAVNTIHTMKTDDPVGIEAYWHKRFEKKRVPGEWFELTAEDVTAFKKMRPLPGN